MPSNSYYEINFSESSPDDNIVESDGNGETQDRESNETNVGGDLGRVRGRQGHRGDGAGGHWDRQTRAAVHFHFLSRETRVPAHTLALLLVPHSSKIILRLELGADELLPGVERAVVLVDIVRLVAVTQTLARVEHLSGRTVAGSEETRASTG